MERKEFLSLIGLGSASALAAVCMGSCSKSTESTTTPGQPTTPTNVNITLDLTLPANASLANSGGYIYTGGIIVAKTISGSFIAVSQSCTHQGTSIQYEGANQRFYCPNHGATFSDTGAVTNGPATTALKQYKTTLSGNILTITS